MSKLYDCFHTELMYMNRKDHRNLSRSRRLDISKIRRYKEGDWDFSILNLHPNLTLEWILEFEEDKWDFHEMSYNSNIDETWLQTFPKANWKFEVLSRHSHINYKWLEAIPDGEWNFQVITYTKEINIDWLRVVPHGNWDIEKLMRQPNFHIDWIHTVPSAKWDFNRVPIEFHQPKYMEKYPQYPWNFKKVSQHNQLELSWLLHHRQADWCFAMLSVHSNLELSWILEFPEAPWNFINISRHPNVTTEWLFRFRKAKWSLITLSSHPNLDIRWLDAFPDGAWSFERIYENKNFKIEWINRRRYFKWGFHSLSRHPDVTLDLFKKFENGIWDIDAIARHPNLTTKWILQYRHLPWKERHLSKNPNFQIEWIDIFPDGDWNMREILSESKRLWQLIKPIDLKIIRQHPLVRWPPEILLHCKKFTIDWPIHLPLLDWLSPENLVLLERRKSLKGTALYKDHPEQKKMVEIIQRIHHDTYDWLSVSLFYKLAKQKIVPNNDYIANIYRGRDKESISREKVNKPIQLQDLSGDIYQVNNWFFQKNLMREIRRQLPPDLGDFDVYLDSGKNNEVGRLFHHGKTPEMKKILLEQPKGPAGMIVYR